MKRWIHGCCSLIAAHLQTSHDVVHAASASDGVGHAASASDGVGHPLEACELLHFLPSRTVSKLSCMRAISDYVGIWGMHVGQPGYLRMDTRAGVLVRICVCVCTV